MPEKKFSLYDTTVTAIFSCLSDFLARGCGVNSDRQELVRKFIQDHKKVFTQNGIDADLMEEFFNPESGELAILRNLIEFSEKCSFPKRVPSGHNYHRLKSIFSEVKISENNKTTPQYYALKTLEAENIFPSEDKNSLSEKEYKSYIGEFAKDFNDIKCQNELEFIESILSLAQHYLWCVPSDFAEDQTVSLYDRIKMTSAVAGALYIFHSERNTLDKENLKNADEKKFLFISGDVSGIQKYIFDLRKSKYAAKTLRSRSFEIQAITLNAVRTILEIFSLSSANAVINAGGRFTLLLPNIQKAYDFLDEYRKDTEEWMVKNYFGEITLNISEGVEASLSKIQEESVVLFKEISHDITDAKQKKLQHYLLENRDNFIIGEDYEKFTSNQDLCEICGKRYGRPNGDIVICKKCESLKIFGEKLPKCSGITIDSHYKDGSIPLAGGKFVRTEEKSAEYSINKFEAGKKVFYSPHFLPKNDRDETLTFEDLAEKSEGAEYIAMLKADLDNLGSIFREGLETLTKISCLSRMLDLFFSLFINSLAEKKGYIYTVFSGGDDLCVLGPWERVIDFAHEFYEVFSRYTGKNPDLTVSAGIALAGPKDPVLGTAEICENFLEESKEKGKDRVTLFQTTVKWDCYKELLDTAKGLKDMVDEDKISTIFLYRLLQYNKMNDKIQDDPKNCLWRSHFYYNMARNIKGEDKDKEDIKDKLLKYFGDEAECGGSIKTAKIPVSWALYMNRKKRRKNGN